MSVLSRACSLTLQVPTKQILSTVSEFPDLYSHGSELQAFCKVFAPLWLSCFHVLELCRLMTIRHPDIRVKHCPYDHCVATLLNPRGVTISHKSTLTVARHANVVVAVTSTVRYHVNYKTKIYYYRWNIKCKWTLHTNNTLKCLNYLLTKHSLATTLRFENENICREGDSNGSKSSYGPVLHSYTWMPYSYIDLYNNLTAIQHKLTSKFVV
jgi:hypothetical protein